MKDERGDPALPDGTRIFDAHLHIVDPRFPLVANHGYLPAPFTVADYRARTAGLGVVGGAVVSGSFQATDQTYLMDALGRLGPHFVGVSQLPAEIADERILALHAAGVRAVRMNLYRGGRESLPALDRLARRVFAVCGWHTELYLDGCDLAELEPVLRSLPRIAVDHLGLSAEGLPVLCRLLEGGAFVKATGFGRLGFDVAPALRALVAANPAGVMFGTDLPSTRARRPFRRGDVATVVDAVGEDLAAAVLERNAVALYRPAAVAGAARPR